ncbi:MAG TPA: hypothetical protein VL443_04880 [Cyclobacteriaceae bacterium]|nr:hypothetical protein [Cyclobacteriaceae bacterium]
MFSQIVINLLHDDHNFCKPTVEFQKGQTSIQKHAERCKVCSLDIVFNLFDNASTHYDVSPLKDSLIVSLEDNVKHILVSFAQGRAPPVFTV